MTDLHPQGGSRLDLEDETDDEVIRSKWVMDGATTLQEAADKLREYALWLEQQHASGWKLRSSVEDDYGFMYQETVT
jgi:hypothetical protein